MKNLLIGVLAFAGLTITPTAAQADDHYPDDTPGCVTYNEFKEITRGMTGGQVFAIADTRGREDEYSPRVYWDRTEVQVYVEKHYRKCDPRNQYDTVQIKFKGTAGIDGVRFPVVISKWW